MRVLYSSAEKQVAKTNYSELEISANTAFTTSARRQVCGPHDRNPVSAAKRRRETLVDCFELIGAQEARINQVLVGGEALLDLRRDGAQDHRHRAEHVAHYCSPSEARLLVGNVFLDSGRVLLALLFAAVMQVANVPVKMKFVLFLINWISVYEQHMHCTVFCISSQVDGSSSTRTRHLSWWQKRRLRCLTRAHPSAPVAPKIQMCNAPAEVRLVSGAASGQNARRSTRARRTHTLRAASLVGRATGEARAAPPSGPRRLTRRTRAPAQQATTLRAPNSRLTRFRISCMHVWMLANLSCVIDV